MNWLLLTLLIVPMANLLIYFPAQAQESRLQAYKKHREVQDTMEREREKGLTAYLEEQEQWQRRRLMAIEEQKAHKKERAERRGSKAYKEYTEERLEDFKQDDEVLKEYTRAKKAIKADASPKLSEYVEYGLIEQRPRYNNKKRALYGAKPNYKPGGNAEHSFSPGNIGSPSSPGFNSGAGAGGPMPPSGMPETSASDFFEPPQSLPPTFDENDFPPPPPPPPPPPFDDGEGF